MFPDSAYRRLGNWIAMALLAAGLATAHALPPAGAKRPATVPAEYVITPFGYVHPSCVTHLAHGDVVWKDESAIQHADGSFENVQACSYPHFNEKGEQTAGNGSSQVGSAVRQPTIKSGWIVSESVTTSTSYGELTAQWTVPPAPSANNGQTIYLFPGLESAQHVVTILQPVLGWNSDFAGAWGIASWNCCVTGTVFESTPVKVSPGDTIYGAMWHTCAPGTLSCPTWDVLTQDLQTGKSTALVNTSSQGQTFNWAFGGVLEVYNVSQCTNYPSNGTMSFHDLILTTNSFVLIPSPAWSFTNSSTGLTPQCSYGASLKQQVTLTY